MSDKFRTTQPLVISFVKGEQPSAAKLSKMAAQPKAGSSLLEKAVGDIWNQSGDAILTHAAPLQLPNLARTLGANKFLNPAIYPLDTDFNFTEDIGDNNLGLTEGYLKFPPKSTSTYSSVGARLGAKKATEDLVLVTGDYWVDSTTGKFKVFTPLVTGDQLIYDVSLSEDYLRGQELLPSVIPDPDQDTFTGCKISTAGGLYYLHLPPRRPIRAGTNTVHTTLPRNYPSTAEETANEQSSEAATPKLLWNNATEALDGVGDEFYRYKLPKEIQDRFSSIAVGEALPAGFLYLWNTTLGTVIEDVVFKKTDVITNKSETVFEVSSASFDFSSYVTADELVASYSQPLTLITVGSSLSQSILKLTQMMSTHEHNSSMILDTPVKHTSLVDTDPVPVASTLQIANYPSYLPDWGSLAWTKDAHVSLLSRGGAVAGGSYQIRDKYNNAMLGHLLMANADLSGADSFIDSTNTDNSFGIYFGDLTGPNLKATSATNVLMTGDVTVTSTAIAPLVLTPVTAPTNNTEGALNVEDFATNLDGSVLRMYDGTRWKNVSGLIRRIDTSELPISITPSSSLAELFASETINFAYFKAGNVIKLFASGTATDASGAGTIDFAVNLGGTACTTISAVVQTSALHNWILEGTFVILVNATGTTDSVTYTLKLITEEIGGPTASWPSIIVDESSSFDLTAGISLEAAWGTPDAGAITCNLYTVEMM
jgi:hypothetical protein